MRCKPGLCGACVVLSVEMGIVPGQDSFNSRKADEGGIGSYVAWRARENAITTTALVWSFSTYYLRASHKIRLLPKFKHHKHCEEVAAGDDQTRARERWLLCGGMGRGGQIGSASCMHLPPSTQTRRRSKHPEKTGTESSESSRLRDSWTTFARMSMDDQHDIATWLLSALGTSFEPRIDTHEQLRGSTSTTRE